MTESRVRLRCVDCGSTELAPGPGLLRCVCGREFQGVSGIYSFLPRGVEPPPAALEGEAQCHEDRGVAARVDRWLAPLLRDLGHGPGATVLSVGCGSGKDVEGLTDRGYECWGLDVGRVEELAARKSRGRLVVGLGEKLPFPDESFDVVYSCGVMEHVGEVSNGRMGPDYLAKREQVMREKLRVLRRGGTAFVACPNRWFPLDVFHPVAGKPRPNAPWDPFLLSVGDVRHLLRRVGAAEPRVLSLKGYFIFERSRRSWWGKIAAPLMSFAIDHLTGLEAFHRSCFNPHIAVKFQRAG